MFDWQLADQLGVSRQAVQLWRKGQRRPSGALPGQIERLTGGDVKARDFERVWQKKRKAAPEPDHTA